MNLKVASGDVLDWLRAGSRTHEGAQCAPWSRPRNACTRTTTSARARTAARTCQLRHCVLRTPLRALAPKTTQRGLDCNWDREFLHIHKREGGGPHQIPLPTCCLSQSASAVARVIAVANGEKQRPQAVLPRSGVSLEEVNQPTNQRRAENRSPRSIDKTLS